MFDYVRSELFRISRNKKLYMLVGIFLVLIAAMGIVLASFGKDPNFPYATTAFALGTEYRGMNYLLLIVLLLSAYLDDNECRQHTMKHSVAYGICRKTIYIARFLAQIIVSVMIYLLMNVALVGISFALLKHSSVGELNELFRSMMAGMPLFLAALAISHCFLMNMESVVSAETFGIFFILILPEIMNLLGKQLSVLEKLAYWMPYNLAAPFINMETSRIQLTWDVPGGMLDCCLSGIVFTMIFTMIGLVMFQKREIK